MLGRVSAEENDAVVKKEEEVAEEGDFVGGVGIEALVKPCFNSLKVHVLSHQLLVQIGRAHV